MSSKWEDEMQAARKAVMKALQEDEKQPRNHTCLKTLRHKNVQDHICSVISQDDKMIKNNHMEFQKAAAKVEGNNRLELEKPVKVEEKAAAGGGGVMYSLKKVYEAVVCDKAPWMSFKDMEGFKPAEDGVSA